MTAKRWVVYMLRCHDGSLYTGVTNDLQRRVETHRAGKGAKYTRSRLPVKLVWWCPAMDKAHAQRMEVEIKSMKRDEKLQLIKEDPET